MKEITTRLSVLLVLVLLVACRGTVDGPAAGVIQPEENVSVPAEGEAKIPEVMEPATPETVTAAFFNWYLENQEAIWAGEREAPATGALYSESEALTPAFKANLAARGGGPADPVLFAQDLPERVEVEGWRAGSDKACVIVHQLWSGSSGNDLTVDLIWADGEWLLDDISPGTPATPEGVTQLFYSWYLDELRPAGGEVGTPLAAGSYRESAYLTPSFVAYVDELVAAGDVAYDPFLLAQDIPLGINVADPLLEGKTATVTLERYYEGNEAPSLVTVQLEEHGQWQIAGVTQDGEWPALTVPQVVEAFYADWRLAYIGDMRVSEESPLIDHAYQNSPYLTEAFIARVDEQVAAGQIARDPFFCAGDVPEVIAVETVEMSGPEATVIVTTDVGTGSFIVTLRLVGANAWLVDDVRCHEAPEPAGEAVSQDTALLLEPIDVSNWEIAVDDEYGVSIPVPPGWVLQPMDMSMMPDDWPVVAGYFLMPESVARAMAAQSGPPDPNAPPVVPPLVVEFLVGDQAAFDRVYLPMASGEEIEINGQLLLVERDRDDYAQVRYTFTDPANSEFRVVIGDAVTAFTGREAAAQDLATVLPGILQGVGFTQ